MAELLVWIAFIISTLFLALGVVLAVTQETMLLAWGLIGIFSLGFIFSVIYVAVDWVSDLLRNIFGIFEDKW